MANYDVLCRTNYFAVTDRAAFEELISRSTAEGKIEISEQNVDGVNKVAFYCYGEIGIKTDDGNAFDAFVTELQRLIPENEAAIIKEIGNEKFCYLIGSGTIVTRHAVESVELDEILMERVSKMLPDRRFITRMDY